MGSDESKERRRALRFPVALPVTIKGWQADGSSWEVESSTEDVSEGGLALELPQDVRLGQVLHMRLPLPKRLRPYDRERPEFEAFTLVRRISRTADSIRVGVMFFGNQPPSGFLERPTTRYLLPGDPPEWSEEPALEEVSSLEEEPSVDEAPAPTPEATGGWEDIATDEPDPLGRVGAERRRWPRHATSGNFTIEVQDEWGMVLKEELTIAADLSRGGACLRSTGDFREGEVLLVQEAGGDFATRGAVRAVTEDDDDAVRLHVEFLDRQAPERLVAPR